MQSKRENLIYVYPSRSTFILRDIEILKEDYNITEFFFDTSNKTKIPFQFLKQFFFLVKNVPSSKAIICHFAGYSSFLPSLISKLFHKKCLIIVAGNDGSKFPDFKYGNYTKKLFGFVTGTSLRFASHILPVHESLYFQNYSYYDGGKPAQGYSFFFPKAKNVPYTPVYYGYDSSVFTILPAVVRKRNTYLTIGNLSDPYSFIRKGYDLIIELAFKRPDCDFTLIGWDGVSALTVPKNVVLLPYMPQNEIIEQFNLHQFYLQLSVMEGFPNALAESMLCGCIPIGSNVSGIPYIIQDSGFILRERNIHLLSNLIDEIKSKSEAELTTLSQKARNRVAAEFTYQNRKEKIIQIINS
jgi:glycosyltransferase involved in cell wall biosynthesis